MHLWCLCKNVPITTCCGTTCQAQSCLFLFLAGIVPNFVLAAKVPNCFWQPKPLLAVGTREHVAFILGSIFLAVKSVFGRILPKIKVGTISAKKSWQTQSSFLLFARTHCHSLCKNAHTTHTTEKHTKSTTHPSSHHTSNTLLTHYTHHTPRCWRRQGQVSMSTCCRRHRPTGGGGSRSEGGSNSGCRREDRGIAAAVTAALAQLARLSTRGARARLALAASYQRALTLHASPRWRHG